ncbi:MAG: hypothetical protein ACT4PI_10775 [Actinomycetota bacterium]
MTTPSSATTTADEQLQASRIFSLSLVISGTRCLLTYIILPWVLPLLGLAGGVGPAVSLVVGLVAIAFNVLSIRRFQRSGHRWRYPLMVLNATVIAFLLFLVVTDIADLGS